MKKEKMTLEQEEAARVYPIYPLSGGGYKIRVYLHNPITNKVEQIPEQSRKWTYSDAKRRYKEMLSLGSAYFNTKTYLEKMSTSNQTVNSNKIPELNIMTLDDLFNRFIERSKSVNKPSYYEGQLNTYNYYIKSFLGDKEINKLTNSMIISWLNILDQTAKKKKSVNRRSKGKFLHSSTKNRITTVLRNIINYGNEFENMKLELKVPTYKMNEVPREIGYWKTKECNIFLSMISQENILDTALFSTFFITGARLGEIRGLHPSNIDFKKKQLIIRGSLCRKPNQTRGLGYEEVTTKSRKALKVLLGDFELDCLRKQIDSIKNIHGYDPETFFIFGGAKPLGTSTIRRKFDSYKAEMKKKYPAINDNVTIHGIRHSVGTDIANTYKSVTLAKEQLGHRSVEVTSKYLHTDSNPEVTESRSRLLHAKRTD